MGVRIIHLVRHGQAEGGDGPLTALGRAQATFTAGRLATQKLPPTRIVSSTLLRARQTAEILATALPNAKLVRTATLCEGWPARPPERWLPADLREPGHDGFFRQEADRHARAYRRFTARVDADTAEVLVAHGNVIAAFVARALGVDPLVWLRMATVNCGLSTVIVPPEGEPVLARFNDNGHLPVAMITGR